MRSTFFLLFLAANAFAATSFIIGGRGGAALTDSATSSFRGIAGEALGHTYTVGPTVGVRLPLNFSVEGDALYNRRSLGLGLAGIGGLNTSADWWEFPVMLKFAPGTGSIAPVLGAGVSVQHIRGFGNVPQYVLMGSTSANSVGFVAGGGVQFRLGPVAVTPELRYTRWSGSTFTQTIANALTGGRNQMQLLVGFTF
jgi:hypothetical protein